MTKKKIACLVTFDIFVMLLRTRRQIYIGFIFDRNRFPKVSFAFLVIKRTFLGSSDQSFEFIDDCKLRIPV